MTLLERILISIGILGIGIGAIIGLRDTDSRIKELQGQVAFLDSCLQVRMAVDKDRFNMLSAEVGWHSNYWIVRDPWTSAELDKYRDYREAWTK